MTPFASSPGPAAVVLLFFASAREAAGRSRDDISAATVGDAMDQARARYGEPFASVLARSRIWVNGEPASAGHVLHDGDEVAVLPPVSGG